MAVRKRAERRAEVEEEILRIGRRHLAEHGAAGLSLRAVTRDLGMVSSAVYRYVANRDELLTLLVVDAYGDLADAVDAAVGACDGGWRDRLLAATRAFRHWAVSDPARYALLYGSPVPGYAAPPERTVEPGTRVVRTVARLVGEGWVAGELAPGPTVTSAALAEGLGDIATELDLPQDPGVVATAAGLWTTLVGAVGLEVFGQYGTAGPPEPDAYLELLLTRGLEAPGAVGRR